MGEGPTRSFSVQALFAFAAEALDILGVGWVGLGWFPVCGCVDVDVEVWWWRGGEEVVDGVMAGFLYGLCGEGLVRLLAEIAVSMGSEKGGRGRSR